MCVPHGCTTYHNICSGLLNELLEDPINSKENKVSDMGGALNLTIGIES